jgi:hypothetical protein
MMDIWRSISTDEDIDPFIRWGYEHSIMAALLPYRPPDRIISMLDGSDREYFVQIGHGEGSSPEIYSGGPGFLISSGGTPRSIISRIVSRPTAVLLDDEETDLGKVLHLAGSMKNWLKWNNTGVHRRFAVSSCPVKIPDGWGPDQSNDLWKVFRRNGIAIGVHSSDDLGIICILDEDPGVAFTELNRLNGDRERLRNTFEFPDGRKLSYDVRSRKSKWVITAVDDEEVDRDLDRWPLMSGRYY